MLRTQLFGNLLGTVEKVMLQFTDHLSAQEKRHAAILSKIEDLGKSISEIEKRSDPPTDSIQPPATAFKVLTVQAENISKSVDSCLSHATATQTSIQAIEKSIAYLSDRVGTIEKIQASKSSNQERSSSSSSAQATQTETLMKSLFEKVEAIEHANLLLLKEKDSQFKSLVAQIEESKTQLESKISDTAAPKKAGKKSKSSASSCLSNFSSCGTRLDSLLLCVLTPYRCSEYVCPRYGLSVWSHCHWKHAFNWRFGTATSDSSFRHFRQRSSCRSRERNHSGAPSQSFCSV